MRLIIIRHGHPEWRRPFCTSLSHFERMSANYDAAHLSREGEEAINHLARQLPKALMLSSDLPRARETAEIIRCESGANIEFDPSFRELKASRIARGLLGKLWAPSVIWSLVHWCCWTLGIGEFSEKPHAAWSRAAKASNKIRRYFETEETIILVSHGWFMILLAIHLRWRRLVEHGPLFPKTSYGAATEYLLRPEYDKAI